MHRARKQFAQGQMLNCWQSQKQNQEYKPLRSRAKNTNLPGLSLITGSPFITFRACWMPCTDWDKFLLRDWSEGRHVAVEICHRPGAMSCLLAYLWGWCEDQCWRTKSLAGYIGSPLLLSDQPRLSYLEVNALYTAPLVQGASSWFTGAQEDVAGQAHHPDTGGSPALMVHNGTVWIHSRHRGDCLFPREYTASLDLGVYVATGDYCSAKAGCCADMTSLLFSLVK